MNRTSLLCLAALALFAARGCSSSQPAQTLSPIVVTPLQPAEVCDRNARHTDPTIAQAPPSAQLDLGHPTFELDVQGLTPGKTSRPSARPTRAASRTCRT
jgi:hypothetical protein